MRGSTFMGFVIVTVHLCYHYCHCSPYFHKKTCSTFPFNRNQFSLNAQAFLFQYPHFWLVPATVRYAGQLPLPPSTTIYGIAYPKGTQGKIRAWHSCVSFFYAMGGVPFAGTALANFGVRHFLRCLFLYTTHFALFSF
jgi:hypothetical protein